MTTEAEEIEAGFNFMLASYKAARKRKGSKDVAMQANLNALGETRFSVRELEYMLALAMEKLASNG